MSHDNHDDPGITSHGGCSCPDILGNHIMTQHYNVIKSPDTHDATDIITISV